MSNKYYFNEDNVVYYGDMNEASKALVVATCCNEQHADYIAQALNLIPSSFDNPVFP